MRTSNILLLLLGPINIAQGQLPLETLHTIEWSENELLVIFTASFPYGSGAACPPFGAVVSYSPGEVHVQTYYDTNGIWPAFFCSRTDTVVIPDPTPAHCNLIIGYNALMPDTVSFGTVDTLMLCSTGIDTAPSLEPVSIGPNPFNDRIWIELPGLSSGPVQVELFDASGRSIHHQYFDRSGSRMELEIPLLPAGHYYLQIDHARGTHRKQLIRE